MKIYRNFEDIDLKGNTIITVGTFDGVHLGHQMIIEHFLETAHNKGQTPVLITFDPHPQIVLKKEGRKPIKLLTLINERLELLEKYGLKNVIIVPFSKEFSQTSPEEFVTKYLIKKTSMKTILVGFDHMFGKDRGGDELLLKQLGKKLDFEVEKINPLMKSGKKISSTSIRNALENKELGKANILLGYNYFFSGKVIKGDSRGLKIGIPTANIKIPELKQMPGNGVYLIKSVIDNSIYFGMANLGLRPTFTDEKIRTFEIHFLEFNKNIYDMDLRIEFLNFIREEKKFDSTQSFLEQIKKDKKTSSDLIKKFYN
jgi:riboflavin kinase / FMN adenylyltransferase